MLLVGRIVGLRVLCIHSFTFGPVGLGKCTRIRGWQRSVKWLSRFPRLLAARGLLGRPPREEMVGNLDVDSKVPVLTGESLKDFKTRQRAVRATWLSLSEGDQKRLGPKLYRNLLPRRVCQFSSNSWTLHC